MLSKKIILGFLAFTLFFTKNAYSEEKKVESLTLKEAITISLENNLDLKTFASDKDIIDAKILQASLLSNPDFSMLFQNLGGDKEVTGGNQITVNVSQKIEFQDKRNANLNAIFSENRINNKLYKIKVLEILNVLEKSFIDFKYIQEKIVLYQEILNISKLTLDTVSEMVKVGKKAPIEQTKMNIIYLENIKKLESLKNQLPFYKEKILLILGKNKDFSKLEYNYLIPENIITFNEIKKQIESNPQLIFHDDKIFQLQEIIKLERIKNNPDLNLNAGYSLFDFSKSGNFALNTGLSLQLPVFNNNQGKIKEIELQIDKLNLEKKALLNSLIINLNNEYKNYSESYLESIYIDKKIIPEVEILFNKIKEGYQVGKFSYLEFLDSQKNLFEYKEKKLNLLLTHYKSLTEIKLITSSYYKGAK